MAKLFNILDIYFEIFKQFGSRYFIFRVFYELRKKGGMLKYKFPVLYPKRVYPTLDLWIEEYSDNFFINAKEDTLDYDNTFSKQLKSETDRILSGEVLFFHSEWKNLGFENEWNVHPITKYNYPSKHWTKLPIYNREIGDIKYVWEKSKFSYLLYLIRNDLRHQEDHSAFVFNEIERWIDHTAPNVGPQYICSQEISIRLLNWCFALFFYKKSSSLREDMLNKILSSIEMQIEHVYRNISFSRISVRNNHSVTETLTLYLISLYFPFFKHSAKYKKYGKRWFEEEIDFQIFDDGSDSQYSFNYHRVKVQLLSWAISSAKVNNEVFSDETVEKARKAVSFLVSMISNSDKGQLPNFGANDGSIYFKLSDNDYSDYLPQLNALASLLNMKLPFNNISSSFKEDEFWFSQKIKKNLEEKELIILPNRGFIDFPIGGYVQIRDVNTQTLLKTPELSFRAGQNDLLHLDIWANGKNILLDSGSYSYNTDEKTLISFNGVAGHNTVSLNGDQHMKKGPRFTWLYKPKHILTDLVESDQYYQVKLVMEVFHPFKYTISRTVKKYKSRDIWEIEDNILKSSNRDPKLVQFWNIEPSIDFQVIISSEDRRSIPINPYIETSYKSTHYGIKEEIIKNIFESKSGYLKTIIEILN